MKTVTQLMIIAAMAANLLACKNVVPDAEVPAVIVDPTEMSRKDLQETVNAALNTDVMLAPSALTDSSVLFIERRVWETIDDSPAQGRNMETPIQFRLVTDGTNCILVDQRDASRHVLADTRCVTEE